MLISDHLAYYFFSALLQANAAIFSIIGVFYIFRIQSLNNKISIIKSNVMEYRGRLIHSSKELMWEKLPIHEKVKELHNKKKQISNICDSFQTIDWNWSKYFNPTEIFYCIIHIYCFCFNDQYYFFISFGLFINY